MSVLSRKPQTYKAQSLQKIMDDYISTNNLIGVPLNEAKRKMILDDLTDLGFVKKGGEAYTLLKYLLKPYGYINKPVGDKNKKEYIISKV